MHLLYKSAIFSSIFPCHCNIEGETAETADEWIDDLPIEELSERLEELKRQREELSNKKLLDEIEALQNDIQRLQVDTDHKETRSSYCSDDI